MKTVREMTLIGMMVLSMPTGCERRTDSNLSNDDQTMTSLGDLDERLLTGLEARRQWKTTGVKVQLARPTITVSLKDSQGTSVIVHPWPSRENDFNIAMMRLDSGPILYAITNDEWEELRLRLPGATP